MDSRQQFEEWWKFHKSHLAGDVETRFALRCWQAGRASMIAETITHFKEIGSDTQTHIGNVIVDLRLMKP